MYRRSLIVAAVIGLAGCAHATLPYKPDPQPKGGRISAAYQIVGDRVRIELDTAGRPLEQVWIIKPDGASVAPQNVDAPRVVTTPSPTFSIGLGGATYGRGVGVGSSSGVGVPIGEGSTRVEGNTIAWFARDTAGPPPWRLYVKLNGIAPATFSVGGPLPAGG